MSPNGSLCTADCDYEHVIKVGEEYECVGRYDHESCAAGK